MRKKYEIWRLEPRLFQNSENSYPSTLNSAKTNAHTHTEKNNVGSATQQQMERHVIKVAMRGGQSPAMTEPILPLHLFALQVAVINHCRGGLGPILVSLKLGPGGDGSQYTPLFHCGTHDSRIWGSFPLSFQSTQGKDSERPSCSPLDRNLDGSDRHCWIEIYIGWIGTVWVGTLRTTPTVTTIPTVPKETGKP